MLVRRTVAFFVVSLVLLAPRPALAQGTIADYQRAMGLRDKYQGLAVNVPEPATWVEKTTHFWYRRSVKGGNEFVLVDAATRRSGPRSITSGSLTRCPKRSNRRSATPR